MAAWMVFETLHPMEQRVVQSVRTLRNGVKLVQKPESELTVEGRRGHRHRRRYCMP